MGRSFFDGIPDFDRGGGGVAARFGRDGGARRTVARVLFASTAAAVVIRALSRRDEYQRHLRSLQDALDASLSADDLTLFSPPDAIAQDDAEASSERAADETPAHGTHAAQTAGSGSGSGRAIARLSTSRSDVARRESAPPASTADNLALHLQFQGNRLIMVESVPGDGSPICPIDHPVKGIGATSLYTLPDDPGYDTLIPTVCFISAPAAERSGFTHVGSASTATQDDEQAS